MMSLFVVVLFFMLTPGVLFSFPKGGSLLMKAMMHAVIFALIYHLTHKMVWDMFYGGVEGFGFRETRGRCRPGRRWNEQHYLCEDVRRR